MRVLQLIDSLNPGGAERMAVNCANALSSRIDKSYLCCTRQEGFLKAQLKEEVAYLFLDKKKSLDVRAFLRLKNFIVKEKIDIVHAHGTSFFLASLIKYFGIRIKLVWHNHNGGISKLSNVQEKTLVFLSKYFDGCISVNEVLNEWGNKNLNCRNQVVIKNFVLSKKRLNTKEFLKGSENSIKIICVANIRPEKDHLNLLKAFEKVSLKADTTLHLVGGYTNSEYALRTLKLFKKSPASRKIFFYGPRDDATELMKDADIGVLTSKYEGLPLVLLEYGMASLAIVCTDVGECKKIIGEDGIIVPSQNSELLVAAFYRYILDGKKRVDDGLNFNKKIKNNFSEAKASRSIMELYHTL